MAASGLAVKVETWLSSTWHVKVPALWLEACIDWIRQENGSGSLSLASVNKQVFEQWLLTDLRDLEYPVLPDCILNEPKGEVNGFYSIQIDSLVDVSQPAYSQLQKIRGKNTVNEEITANTQGFLKSWEAKPTRMLMLQLTDGIHHVQGMEYHPIPVLNSSLLPGTKIMIKGKVAYRLGVLLLTSENVKLLGGEVDSLVEDYSEEKVLARLIGEENDNGQSIVRADTGESGTVIPADEMDQALGPSDEELLASLGESNDLMVNEIPTESGYCSASLISATHFPPITTERFQQGSAAFSGETEEQSIPIMEEDFDEFPLDNLLLEEEIQQQQVLSRSTSINNQLIRKSCEGRMHNIVKENIDSFDVNHNVQHIQNLDSSLRNKVMEEGVNKNIRKPSSISSTVAGSNRELDQYSDFAQISCSKNKCHKIGLDTLPFAYLSILLGNKPKGITVVKVKAFIVTLTGNLTNNDGLWSVTAKISDGTAYLEVNFADEILTSLIGFSVPEMKQAKKDPVLNLKLKKGLQNCQRELIDLCCLMTIEFNPFLPKATVVVLQDINANDVSNLKTRLNLNNNFDPCCVVLD